MNFDDWRTKTDDMKDKLKACLIPMVPKNHSTETGCIAIAALTEFFLEACVYLADEHFAMLAIEEALSIMRSRISKIGAAVN